MAAYQPNEQEVRAIHWYVDRELTGQKNPGAATIIKHSLLNNPDAKNLVARIMVDYKNANPQSEIAGRGI